MAFTSSRGGVPQTPTLPTGVQIASFDTYLEAQRAVDQLSDKEFEVQRTTIVGTDLRMVERITGRLSYPRVALAGAMSGAWFGLFVGLIFGLLSEGGIVVMLLPALVIGAAFGILFALVSYAFTGGKRDFTSSSQVVAGRYALLCEQDLVGEAVRLLGEAGIRTRVGGDAATAPAGAPGWQHGAPGGAQPGPYGASGTGSPPAPPGAPGQPGPYGAQGQQPGPYDAQGQQPGPYGAQGQQPGPYGAQGQQPGPYGAQGQPGPDAPTDDAPAPGVAGQPGAAPAAPSSPPRGFTPWEDEHGNPRYGQRRPAEPRDGEERSS